MRVLTITNRYFPAIGGIQVVVQQVCEHLVKNGHRCTVITLNSHGRAGHELINGVEIIRLDRSRIYLYDYNAGLMSLLKDKLFLDRFDVVHIHGYHNLLSFEAAFLLKQRGKKIVFSPYYHGKGHTLVSNALFNLYKPIGSHIFIYADQVICASGYEKQLLSKDFKIDGHKICTIPIGVKEINTKTLDIEAANMILYVSSLNKYKGLEYILHAARALTARNTPYKLEIIGKGRDEKYFKSVARKLGLGNVTWTGSVSEERLYEKYREAGVLVLLSNAESYGLVVAEALSQGTPCIVTDTTALSEFLKEPGCYGVSYPPDIDMLADTIVKVFRENLAVGPFSDKIRTWDRIVRDYEGLYRDLLS